MTTDDLVFPEEYASTPGVLRYLEDRSTLLSSGEWVDDYEPILKQEVTPGWAKPSIAVLKRLDTSTEGAIKRTTPDQAVNFLAHVRSEGGSVAWRNRVLSMCTRFFDWAVDTKRRRNNPFSGIKMLKEPRQEEIVYCTRKERDRIIAMAKASGWTDWIAVPIAFYAGMRKEEVARMHWKSHPQSPCYEGALSHVPIPGAIQIFSNRKIAF